VVVVLSSDDASFKASLEKKESALFKALTPLCERFFFSRGECKKYSKKRDQREKNF